MKDYVSANGMNRWGGAISFRDPDHLLVAIGDAGQNGIETVSQQDLVSDDSSALGKVLLVDIKRMTYEIFTKGHRVPLGLFVGKRNIYETENGPTGGDELNLLTGSLDYGYPHVSLGVYHDPELELWRKYPQTHPKNPHPLYARHDGYERPIFSWSPAIAPSAIVELPDVGFGYWNGALLMASLKGKSLFRILLDQDRSISKDRVILVERIGLGERIRHMAFSNHEIFISTDDSETLEGKEKIGIIDLHPNPDVEKKQ